MKQIPPIANRQCGVFSAVQAEPHGWTRDALRWAVRSGQLIKLRPATYQCADLEHLPCYERQRWRHAGPAVAATLTTPGASASHSAAAVLRGLPLAFLPDRSCVSVTPTHTGEIAQVHVHRAAGEMFASPVGAVACTSVERTLLDLAREHGVMLGVVAMDYALHHGLTDVDRLEAMLLHAMRWPGVVNARTAAAAADPRSESPLESRSRLKFVEHALPRPQPQVRIGDENGRFVARVDFHWDKQGVVGEVDGSLKYTAEHPDALVHEKWRQEALERTGLIVVRWGAKDLADFTPTAQRLRRALSRGEQRADGDRRWTLLPPDPRTDFDPAVGVNKIA